MRVPEGWYTTVISSIADLKGGTTPPRSDESYWGGSNYWATPSDLTALSAGTTYIRETAQTITDNALTGTSAFLLPERSVLMTSRATIGWAAINTAPMATNQGFCSFLPKPELHPEFLLYWIFWKRRDLERLAGGSTFLEVSKHAIRSLEIVLPPLPEQKKIAAILSSVDETIQATRETIEQTKKVKQGLMQELLTRGIGHTRFKKTEIGEIPETWKVCKLFEIGEVSKSHGGSKKDSIEMGFPCVRYGELYTTHRTFIKQFTSYISESSRNSYTRIQLGDVLFAGSGETHEEIGMAATLLRDIEAYAGGDIILFRPSASVSYHYLGHVVNSPVVNLQKSRFGQGSSVIHLYAYQVEQLKIPIPPLDEQRQIAAVFSSVDYKIESDETLVESLQILKKGLMQDLLTGKVRVAV